MLVLRPLIRPLLLGGALAAGLPAVESGLFPTGMPDRERASIAAGPLTVLVPADQAEALRPLAARAEAVYRRMAADAGVPAGPLTVILDDDLDLHNGFSSTVPDDVVAVWLAPAPPRSGIFAADHLERTLVHELAHHLSNTAARSEGFRAGMQRVFGRVSPGEPLSLGWFLLTTPAHVTQPAFWHEGLAQWAETAYADPASPWAGRGRDSLTHLVWRLDAAAGAIPGAEDWRPGWHAWPYGNRVYLYGVADTRWLAGAYGRRASVWALVESQARQGVFAFDDGVQGPLGRSHADLIGQARADLLAEQRASLAALRSRPVTAVPRLTPAGTMAGAPAWLPDGRLATALSDPWGEDRVVLIDAAGASRRTRLQVRRDTELRSCPEGALVYADSIGLGPTALLPAGHDGCCGADAAWQRALLGSRVVLMLPDGGVRTLEGARLVQPDVRRDGDGWAVAAVRFAPAGGQELVRCRVGDDGAQSPWTVVETRDRPWSPAFRPGGGLAWVEVHAGGSRLVLADEAGRRGELAAVRGRLLHPAWERDGAGLFVCADHTGVPNAWHLRADRPGELVAVTSTVGGIIACVPSPDGGELAVVEHDRDGPYAGRIPNRPGEWPGTIPAIALAWPAPVAPRDPPAPPVDPRPPSPLPAPDGGAAPPAEPYRPLAAIRPLFWTPTTMVTDRGGYGVAGVAADPLRSHELVATAGVGANEHTPTGLLSWTASPWPVQVQALAWRDERAFDDRLAAADGGLRDYVENTDNGELRLGYGLSGPTGRRGFAYLAGGLSDHDRYDTGGVRTRWDEQPFTGEERYAEVAVGFASTTLFPTSYTREDGSRVALAWRHSGLGGALEGDRLLADGSWVASVWPRGGHQLVLGGALGWSRDDRRWMQGRFQVGGPSGLDIPRGYTAILSTGAYLMAWSTAYRLPVLRPWEGFGTSPLALRQVVLEAFWEGAKASDDHPGGGGPWLRSAGAELHADLEFWATRLAPGVGVARQLDGAEDTVGYVTMAFVR